MAASREANALGTRVGPDHYAQLEAVKMFTAMMRAAPFERSSR